MYSKAVLAGALAGQVAAFPWVANQDGVDSGLYATQPRSLEARAACPYNANHKAAVPISTKYPYCSAVNGAPGKFPCTNNQVPAPGDTAHAFTAPGPNDIRGPCPGINAAANHNFLAHDGITTFNELVDMQQNVYGVGWDLAVLLATLGVGLDGDVASGKLSIGCASNAVTSSLPLLSNELGLDGHNKFEGDSSLTRNDYFLANGDNHSFNGTLFKEMSDVAQGSYDRKAMTTYRKQRYDESLNTNGNFYFGPKSLLLFGAASFLYELMPSGDNGPPDEATITSFFGTKKESDGTYSFSAEKIPDNWFSRSKAYSIPLVANEIGAQYFGAPVAFGGNLGVGHFVGIGLNGLFTGNLLNGSDPNAAECLLYMVATENVPSAIGGGGTNILSTLSDDVLGFMRGKVGPIQKNSPCPMAFNNA